MGCAQKNSKRELNPLVILLSTLCLAALPCIIVGHEDGLFKFITHHAHYDDGTISEHIDYNTSDSKPSFGAVGKELFKGVSKTAERIGKALHIIKDQKETSGLDTNKTFFSGVVSNFKKQINLIYPGTQWCGNGDRAKSFDDLGRFETTDICCRSHDVCPESISPKQTKFELENTGLFTRSHCDCDEEFHKCLKTSNTVVSKKIGFTYFTILGPQCFREAYPIIGCIQYIKGKCIKYHLNENEARKYQWFDNEPY